MVGTAMPVIGFAALLMLSLLPACSGAPRTLFGKSIDGQVLDAQTGQPFAGAHVMYVYESASLTGPIFGEPSSEVCYHAVAAMTDVQGHFRIAAWEKPQPYKVPNREPTGSAYAHRYVPAVLAPPEGRPREPTGCPNDIYRPQLSHADGDKRLEELRQVLLRGCIHGGASQRSLYPMLKAAYDEARAVAVTPAQQKRVSGYAEIVALVWIAPDPLGDAGVTNQKIERFVRENLQ